MPMNTKMLKKILNSRWGGFDKFCIATLFICLISLNPRISGLLASIGSVWWFFTDVLSLKRFPKFTPWFRKLVDTHLRGRFLYVATVTAFLLLAFKFVGEPLLDLDRDGLPFSKERQIGTYANDPDCDNDLLKDGYEYNKSGSGDLYDPHQWDGNTNYTIDFCDLVVNHKLKYDDAFDPEQNLSDTRVVKAICEDVLERNKNYARCANKANKGAIILDLTCNDIVYGKIPIALSVGLTNYEIGCRARRL